MLTLKQTIESWIQDINLDSFESDDPDTYVRDAIEEQLGQSEPNLINNYIYFKNIYIYNDNWIAEIAHCAHRQEMTFTQLLSYYDHLFNKAESLATFNYSIARNIAILCNLEEIYYVNK